MTKVTIHGNISPSLIATLLTEFITDFPEGRTRMRNAVIYGPVEGPYVAMYRTVGGAIVMRECE